MGVQKLAKRPDCDLSSPLHRDGDLNFEGTSTFAGHKAHEIQRSGSAPSSVLAPRGKIGDPAGPDMTQDSLATLAGAVAHHVNNPLMGIGGALEIIRNHTENPDHRFVLNETIARLAQLRGILRSLERFSAPIRPRMLPVAVEPIVTQANTWVFEQAPCNDIRLESECPQLAVMGDEYLLRQAYQELLFNAAQASARDASILVRIRASGAFVGVEVLDRGTGIAKEHLARAFEPFFSTRTNRAGLGLPLSRRIALAHGGSLQLYRRATGGMSACMKLPRLSGPGGCP